MFGAFFDLLMVPVNFVRKTFGWMPDEAEGDGDGATTETVELQEATVANGGPSASNFAAMQEAVYGDDAAGSTSMSTTDFAGLSIYVQPQLKGILGRRQKQYSCSEFGVQPQQLVPRTPPSCFRFCL